MYEKNIILEMGHDVVVANCMIEAQNLIDTHKRDISLSIVDVNLPEDGHKVLDYLLKYNIPSIATTGSFHPELREEIIASNVIDYIVLEDDQNLELLRSIVKRVFNNQKRRILIVDDSASSRMALKKLLLSQNFTIHEADGAKEALSILSEHNDISIALIDYEMPGQTGADLTRIIRKSYSRMELAILAISIHTKPIITIEFLKAGANDFITKPYIKEEVLARIAVNIDLLDQHHNLVSEIKERKEIEKKLKISQAQAQSATTAKSYFLANMSHEIRTPMNAILGFVDLLYKEEESDDKRKKLDIIKESGTSLMHIIDDILDFSKIESGKISLDNVLFNSVEPFELIVELFRKRADERDITLSMVIDDQLPSKAYGDITKVKQIFSNLISNALKFSKESSTIDIKVALLNENSLVCHVKDSGVGVSEDNIEKIFRVFEQEDDSTTRHYGGTGLGLPISRSLAQMMGGELYVDSTLGEGSTFTFHVELFSDVQEHISDDMEDSSLVSEKPLIDNAAVLVVEDNKSNQLLMTLLLDEIGVSCDIANDGLEAIDAYKQRDYSLILMDENMPNLNGIEATKQIRTLEQKNNKKPLPIVAITANALKGDRERFIAAGMDDYLTKPIDNVKLNEVLQRYLTA